MLNDLIANDPEINPELKRLWIPEYFAIKNYILSIGSKILYRKIGLAQGSSLSPMLFNYYISKILEANALYRYINDPNIKTYIYADNILILTNKEYSIEYINDMIDAYTFACAQFNLSFNNPIIKRFTKVGIPICDLDVFPNIKDTFKILGIEFYIINNSLCINYYPMIFNIKRINCCSFYIAIKYIKKYHLPKFNYYFKFIKCINNIQAEAYKTWFIDKINNWIKNVAIIYKLPNDCIENKVFANNILNWIKVGNTNYHAIIFKTLNYNYNYIGSCPYEILLRKTLIYYNSSQLEKNNFPLNCGALAKIIDKEIPIEKQLDVNWKNIKNFMPESFTKNKFINSYISICSC